MQAEGMRYEAHQPVVAGQRCYDASDITTGKRMEREQASRLCVAPLRG